MRRAGFHRSPRQKLGDPDCPFDLGVHLNLTQGRPLGEHFPAELLDADGRFSGVFPLFWRLRGVGDRFHAAISGELERQLQFVCDHGLRPTHLNGHQYIEMIPAVTAVLPELLRRFGIQAVRVAWERSTFRSTVLGGHPSSWPMACVKRAFAGRFRTRMAALKIPHSDVVFFGTAHAGRLNLRLLRLFLAIGGMTRWWRSVFIQAKSQAKRPQKRLPMAGSTRWLACVPTSCGCSSPPTCPHAWKRPDGGWHD